jgi:hypothetical protein
MGRKGKSKMSINQVFKSLAGEMKKVYEGLDVKVIGPPGNRTKTAALVYQGEELARLNLVDVGYRIEFLPSSVVTMVENTLSEFTDEEIKAFVGNMADFIRRHKLLSGAKYSPDAREMLRNIALALGGLSASETCPFLRIEYDEIATGALNSHGFVEVIKVAKLRPCDRPAYA